jgi:hypothetical protein
MISSVADIFIESAHCVPGKIDFARMSSLTEAKIDDPESYLGSARRPGLLR